jgi:hypothetical protein
LTNSENQSPVSNSLDSILQASKEDVTRDLEKIHAAWSKRGEEHKSISTETELIQVSPEGNKLFFGSAVLEKGTTVIITKRGIIHPDQLVTATVTKVSPTEVLVKQVLEKGEDRIGSSARIPISHLRSGRCTLTIKTSTTVNAT